MAREKRHGRGWPIDNCPEGTQQVGNLPQWVFIAAVAAGLTGSACTSGSLEPSHVLRTMGVPFTAIHGSIRFSLSRYNTDSEIEKVIEVMPPIIKELRMLSPYGRERLAACAPDRDVSTE